VCVVQGLGCISSLRREGLCCETQLFVWEQPQFVSNDERIYLQVEGEKGVKLS
jgi:hypothetical protein